MANRKYVQAPVYFILSEQDKGLETYAVIRVNGRRSKRIADKLNTEEAKTIIEQHQRRDRAARKRLPKQGMPTAPESAQGVSGQEIPPILVQSVNCADIKPADKPKEIAPKQIQLSLFGD